MASRAAAQDEASGLKISAWAAYDGHFKYGEWLPIWVQLENSGNDLQVDVRVRIPDGWGGTIYAVQVDLPSQSRKLVPLYVLPNNFSRELLLEVHTKDGKLAEVKTTTRPQPNITYLVGYISPQAGAISIIQGVSFPGQARPIVLVDVQLSDIPDRHEGLRSFDTLILNDVDTSQLSPAQKDSIENWVRHGGRLVIGGGVNAMQTVSGLSKNLLPVSPTTIHEINTLPDFERFASGNEVRIPGPFVVASGDVVGGTSLVGDENLTLLQESRVGKGFVDFIALDLTASPFDAWAGTTDFWKALLSPGAEYPEWMPWDMSFSQRRAGTMVWALSNLPTLDLPSVRSLALLLGVYILLVGPLNYLVLRWKRRLHFAWITIPLITIIFSAGTFGLGYAMRGTDLILNKVAIVEISPDGTTSISSYMGIFSPAQQSYEIEVTGDSLLSPLRPDYDPWGMSSGTTTGTEAVFIQGDPGFIHGLSVNQWAMQSFMTEGKWPNFGTIVSDLKLEGNFLVGSVRNETNYTFTDAVILLGNRFTHLGDFAPGDENQIKMELPTLVGHPFESPITYQLISSEPGFSGFEDRTYQLKQSVLDSVFPWGNPSGPILGSSTPFTDMIGSQQALLMGWFDIAPPEVLISGRKPAQITTSLLFAPLPFTIPQSDQLTLIPGMIPGKIVELPQDGGYCGSGGMPAVYFGRGEAVFEFQAPEFVNNAQIEKLLLYIGTEGGWNRIPQTYLFDWTAGDWREIQSPTVGNNNIHAVEGVVSSSGMVRVRLLSENFGGGCYYVALGLEGLIEGGQP
ncbi:MAG: hypothetical protein IBX69_12745 [Anaerolineales bacterium]|nr:hypothetical protein [Anaerolineales bacterium]